MNNVQLEHIRRFVKAGHALHPEDCRALLDAFDAHYRALDRLACGLKGAEAEALELLYDKDGNSALDVPGIET